MNVEYDSAVEGGIYEYGFTDWDGKDLSTCTLQKTNPLDQNAHYTRWSNSLKRTNGVCSNVIRVRNGGTGDAKVMFLTLGGVVGVGSGLLMGGIGMVIMLIS